jgi:hypothetical protein
MVFATKAQRHEEKTLDLCVFVAIFTLSRVRRSRDVINTKGKNA